MDRAISASAANQRFSETLGEVQGREFSVRGAFRVAARSLVWFRWTMTLTAPWR